MIWPITELLPHSGSAIFIDKVISFDEERLTASTQVKPTGHFNLPDGSLPPWLGLEIMAQAVAAWAGCQALRDGLAVQLGFLLGTRRYNCHVTSFAPGTHLTIHATRSFQDESGMGTFECELLEAGRIVASARVNVFSPPDVNSFIQETPPPHE